MDMKKMRHFLCGLVCGAAGMQWYAVSATATLERMLFWLQSAADEYRETHDVPEVNTGWQPRKKKEESSLIR
jgi:hypothetical protein